MNDRTYWHVPGARSWHAQTEPGPRGWSACGRRQTPGGYLMPLDWADRIPPTAHLCGNCARIIAARTDVEEDPTYGNQVAPV